MIDKSQGNRGTYIDGTYSTTSDQFTDQALHSTGTKREISSSRRQIIHVTQSCTMSFGPPKATFGYLDQDHDISKYITTADLNSYIIDGEAQNETASNTDVAPEERNGGLGIY